MHDSVAIAKGRSRLTPVAIAATPSARLIGWQDAHDHVRVMPIKSDGSAAGDAVDTGLPTSSDYNMPHFRDGGFWIKPLPGGFAVFIQHRVRGRFKLTGQLLNAEGRPQGEALQVEGCNFAYPHQFHWITHERGLFALRPMGRLDRMVMERFWVEEGTLRREELRAKERGRPLAFAVSDEHAVGIAHLKGKLLLRSADGSEHEITGLDKTVRILNLGFADDGLTLVYETQRGRRRPSWAVSMGFDGTLATPVEIERETPIPAPFTNTVDAVVTIYTPPDAVDNSTDEYRLEMRTAAHHRLSDPVGLPWFGPGMGLAWMGEHFLIGYGDHVGPRQWELVTQRVDCR